MKQWLTNNKFILTGMVVGALTGYFYYRFIGCSGGTCLITSKPVNSTLYFAAMGAIFFNLFRKERNGKPNNRR